MAAGKRQTSRFDGIDWETVGVQDRNCSYDVSQPVGSGRSVFVGGLGQAARHFATTLCDNDAWFRRRLPAAALWLGRPRHGCRARRDHVRMESDDSVDDCSRRPVLRVGQLEASLSVSVRRACAPLRRPTPTAAAACRLWLRQGAQRQTPWSPTGTSYHDDPRTTTDHNSKTEGWWWFSLRMCWNEYQLHLSVMALAFRVN